MKVSRILETIGSGTVLLLVGVFLIALSLAYAFVELTHLPLWACLGAVGIMSAFGGYALVNRGADETEEQVKQFSVVEHLKNPWVIAGAAVFGGLILSRLTRRPRINVIEKIIEEPVTHHDVIHRRVTGETPSRSKQPTSFFAGLSQVIGEKFRQQLRTLGAQAATAAVELGTKSLGIPPVDQLLDQLMGDHKQEEQRRHAGPSDETQAEPRPRGANGRQPQRAYNTGNRNDNFYSDNL